MSQCVSSYNFVENVELETMTCLNMIVDKISNETYDNNNDSNSSLTHTTVDLVSFPYQLSSHSDAQCRNICGLQNLGNTCFMNSILQCLITIPSLVKYYIRLKNMFSSMNNNSMSKAFIDLIESMEKQNTVQPNAFKSALRQHAPVFQNYGQQDAHECLTMILDALHKESSRQMENGEEQSIITDLFQGQMKYTIKCSLASQCGNITNITDPFFDLPLFIEPKTPEQTKLPSTNRSWRSWLFNKGKDIILGRTKRFLNLHRQISPLIMWIILHCFCLPYRALFAIGYGFKTIFKSDLTLKQCLINNISIVEHTPSNNTWFCSQCQQNRYPTKENHILSLPNVLIIHLKRFDMESSSPNTKIDTLVKYPLVLDMTEFLSEKSDEKQIYDLVSVCLHSGSFTSGHYITYARRTSGWFCFNDSHVFPISIDNIVNPNAYILFYLKRD